MHHPIPTAGTFGYEPYQRTSLGINRGIESHGMYMNVRTAQMITDRSGDKDKAKQLMLQVGMLSSALEHSVPEQMFADPDSATKPEGFSTVKALGMAIAQGQKVYTINQQNRNTALANLRLDTVAMSEINSALASGREVTTHTDQLTVPGFRGSGYSITDPVTGEGVYKISGGKNGGFIGIGAGAAAATVVAGMLLPSAVLVASSIPVILALLAPVIAFCAGQLIGLMLLDRAEGITGPVNTANCFLAGFAYSFTATLVIEAAFIPHLQASALLAKVLAAVTAAAGLGAYYLPNLRDCGVLP
jgi:hypothetical protein